MAGPLTWREVDAPNFRGSMEGFNNFSNLINNAFQSATNTLNDIDRDKSEKVNKAFMANVLGLDNAETAGADVRDLLDNASDRVSLASMMTASRRPGELLDEASKKFGFQKDKTLWDRNETQYAAEKAADPLRIQISTLLDNNQVNEARALMSKPENQAIMSSLGYKGVNDFLAGNRDILRDNQAYAQSGERFGWDRYNHERGVHNNSVQDAARILGERLARTGYDGANFDQDMADWGIDPEVSASLRGRFGNYSPMSGGGAATLGSVSGYQGVANDVAATFGLDPLDVAAVMSFETGGKFDPNITNSSGHLGLIQFGKNEQAKYGITKGSSPEEWTKAVTSFLNDRGFKKGMGIEDLYSTILTGSPGNYDRTDINGTSVRNAVPRILAEHRANAAKWMQTASAVADQGTQQQLMQDNANGIAVQLQNSKTDLRPITQVLQDAKAIFPEASSGNLMGQINDVIARAKNQGVTINPATALVLMQNSTDQTMLGVGWLGELNPYSLGDGISLNNSKIDDGIAQLKSGADQRTVVTNQSTAVNQATKQQAQAQYAAAGAELKRVMEQYSRNPNMDPRIVQRAQTNYAIAEAALGGAIQTSGNSVRSENYGATAEPAKASKQAAPAIAAAASAQKPAPASSTRKSGPERVRALTPAQLEAGISSLGSRIASLSGGWSNEAERKAQNAERNRLSRQHQILVQEQGRRRAASNRAENGSITSRAASAIRDAVVKTPEERQASRAPVTRSRLERAEAQLRAEKNPFVRRQIQAEINKLKQEL